MYSPQLGRFLSQDPYLAGKPDILYDNDEFGDRLTMMRNLYGYVDNNPINRTDPSGLGDFTNKILKKACADISTSPAMQKICEEIVKNLKGKTCNQLFSYCQHLCRHPSELGATAGRICTLLWTKVCSTTL